MSTASDAWWDAAERAAALFPPDDGLPGLDPVYLLDDGFVETMVTASRAERADALVASGWVETDASLLNGERAAALLALGAR